MPLTAIITHADLETIERTTYSATDSAAIDTLIGWTEGWLQALTFSWAYSASASVTVYGDGTRYLDLKRWNNTFSAITIDGTALTAAELADVRSHGFYLRRLGGEVWDEDEEVIVTGAWGWDSSASVPAAYATMERLMVRNLWTAYASRDLQSLSVGDWSATYGESTVTTNSALMQMLGAYSLPAVV